MTINRLDQLVAVFLILFGGWMAATGMDLGIQQGTTPGAGLFPLILGLMIAGLSVINLYRSLRGLEVLDSGMARADLIRILLLNAILIVAVLLVDLLGLTLATGLSMLGIGLVLAPQRSPGFVVKLGIVSIATAGLCLILFERVLAVPIPSGILGF